jgi:hypothetical protein
MRELENCPSCGSGDVGGASGIVHCYKCKFQVRAAATPEACDKWNALAIFTRHGAAHESEQFYAAVRALLDTDRERRSNPSEDAMNDACRDLPDGYLIEVNLERGAGWIAVRQDGNAVDYEDDPDTSMTQRIRDAIAYCKGEPK